MNIQTRSSGQNESPTPNAEVLAFSRPSLLLAKAWHQSSSHPARMWTGIRALSHRAAPRRSILGAVTRGRSSCRAD